VSAAVRDVLVRGVNAGILEHRGVKVGRPAGEPIVDREVFDRVRALVLGRRRGRAYGDRYIGTGFLRCGRCKALLSTHPHGTLANGEPRRVYFCNTQRRGCGKITAMVSYVDERLEEFVVERLSDPKHAAGLSAFRARRNERLNSFARRSNGARVSRSPCPRGWHVGRSRSRRSTSPTPCWWRTWRS
jgi:site-specific DNA recombinase